MRSRTAFNKVTSHGRLLIKPLTHLNEWLARPLPRARRSITENSSNQSEGEPTQQKRDVEISGSQQNEWCYGNFTM